MVIACGAQPVMLRELLSRHSGSMIEEGEVYAVHKPTESKELQTRNSKLVAKIDEERLDKDWNRGV